MQGECRGGLGILPGGHERGFLGTERDGVGTEGRCELHYGGKLRLVLLLTKEVNFSEEWGASQ